MHFAREAARKIPRVANLLHQQASRVTRVARLPFSLQHDGAVCPRFAAAACAARARPCRRRQQANRRFAWFAVAENAMALSTIQRPWVAIASNLSRQHYPPAAAQLASDSGITVNRMGDRLRAETPQLGPTDTAKSLTRAQPIRPTVGRLAAATIIVTFPQCPPPVLRLPLFVRRLHPSVRKPCPQTYRFGGLTSWPATGTVPWASDPRRATTATLRGVAISLHCWQGDDVGGFENSAGLSGGGIQATGSSPGKARTADELRSDLEEAACG